MTPTQKKIRKRAVDCARGAASWVPDALEAGAVAEALDALDAAERRLAAFNALADTVIIESDYVDTDAVGELCAAADPRLAALVRTVSHDLPKVVEQRNAAERRAAEAEGDMALLREYGVAREEYRWTFGVQAVAAAARKEAVMSRIRERARALASGSGGNGGTMAVGREAGSNE